MTNSELAEDFENEVWQRVDTITAKAKTAIIEHPTDSVVIDVPLSITPGLQEAVVQRRGRSFEMKSPTTGAIHIIQMDPEVGKYVAIPPQPSAHAA